MGKNKDYESVNWAPLERVTSSKLNRMAKNSDYLEDRKLDGSLRNMNEEMQGRPDLPYVTNNLVMYAEHRAISPGGAGSAQQKGSGGGKPTFSKTIKFPSGFFDPEYLPVVIASVGAKNGIKAITYTISNVTSQQFTITIREDTAQRFSQKMNYFVSFVAFGVKN